MKLLCLDCDSTLSQIEGVDELATAKGPAVKQQIIDLTNMAMSGEIAIEDIFGKRLDLIQPTKELCTEVGQLYIEKEAKDVKKTLERLVQKGWTPIIISGGFIDPIQPFADYLNITEVHAVPLKFDQNGNYTGFVASPTTRNGGKPEIIETLKEKYSPEVVVMVGDGVSDLETAPNVDMFIGFGEFEERSKVKEGSTHFAYNFSDVEKLVEIYS